jgi:AcrR family transcriptional regulator
MSTTTPPPAPLSRAEQQERTRAALIAAADEAFAREGFHAANLDAIAAAAGFTKGAVYSNFASKAGLYLAVLDRTIEDTLTNERSPFDAYAEEVAQGRLTPEEVEAAIRGHVLASLEFVATAMRDPELAAQLDERVQRLVRGFVGMVEQWRSPDDPLPADELGVLVYAFQQGLGLVQGLGIEPSGTAVEEARRRLVTPREPG